MLTLRDCSSSEVPTRRIILTSDLARLRLIKTNFESFQKSFDVEQINRIERLDICGEPAEPLPVYTANVNSNERVSLIVKSVYIHSALITELFTRRVEVTFYTISECILNVKALEIILRRSYVNVTHTIVTFHGEKIRAYEKHLIPRCISLINKLRHSPLTTFPFNYDNSPLRHLKLKIL